MHEVHTVAVLHRGQVAAVVDEVLVEVQPDDGAEVVDDRPQDLARAAAWQLEGEPDAFWACCFL